MLGTMLRQIIVVPGCGTADERIRAIWTDRFLELLKIAEQRARDVGDLEVAEQLKIALDGRALNESPRA
jgi:hypothetical protein